MISAEHKIRTVLFRQDAAPLSAVIRDHVYDVPGLVELLDSDDDALVCEAIRAIGLTESKAGNTATSVLTALLVRAVETRRSLAAVPPVSVPIVLEACRALARIRSISEVAGQALMDIFLLYPDHEDLATTAWYSLRLTDAFVRSVRSILKSADSACRYDVLHLLMSDAIWLGPEDRAVIGELAPDIVACVADEDLKVRAMACKAIYYAFPECIGLTRIIDALHVDQQCDPSDTLLADKQVALDARRLVNGQILADVEHVYTSGRNGRSPMYAVLAELRHISTITTPLLHEIVQHERHELQSSAATALGVIGPAASPSLDVLGNAVHMSAPLHLAKSVTWAFEQMIENPEPLQFILAYYGLSDEDVLSYLLGHRRIASRVLDKVKSYSRSMGEGNDEILGRVWTFLAQRLRSKSMRFGGKVERFDRTILNAVENRLINEYRRAKLRKMRSLSDVLEQDLVSGKSEDSEKAVAHAETIQSVRTTWDSLLEHEQLMPAMNAVKLRVFHGMPFNDIAEQLDLGVGDAGRMAAKRLYERGIDVLRERLRAIS